VGDAPCTPYVTGDELQAALGDACVIDDPDRYANAATEALWVLTGRQFPNGCQMRVRPRLRDDCYGGPLGLYGGVPSPWGGYLGFGPFRHVADQRIALVTPVATVDEVKIDGAAFTAWMLVDGAFLERTDGKCWPTHQDLRKPATETDTFEVTYTVGPLAPQIVKDAALELAIALWKSRPGANTGGIPATATGVQRQGMSVTTQSAAQMARESGSTLPQVQAAIGTYNPSNLRVPPALWTPDEPWVLHTVQYGS